jgi:hypothetical protein
MFIEPAPVTYSGPKKVKFFASAGLVPVPASTTQLAAECERDESERGQLVPVPASTTQLAVEASAIRLAVPCSEPNSHRPTETSSVVTLMVILSDCSETMHPRRADAVKV